MTTNSNAHEIAYIGMGANLGAKEQTLSSALSLMEEHRLGRIERVSSLYQTAPIGGPPQPDYLNAVVALNTNMSPVRLLQHLQHLEIILGRQRTVKWGPRTIDLDLLMLSQRIVSIQKPILLTIPHPRMHLRRFVLLPFTEIAPDSLHPVFLQTIQKLSLLCEDHAKVSLFQSNSWMEHFVERKDH